MKKIDYYAVQQQWRMPKWLGATVGGIFGFILIVSGVAIVKLTRTPVPVAALAAAPAPSAAAAAPAATTAPAAQAAPAVAAPVAAPAAPAVVADAGSAKKHHGKHHAAASSHHASSHAVASKHSAKGGMTLASSKHDGNKKLKDKDALDKLLGL